LLCRRSILFSRWLAPLSCQVAFRSGRTSCRRMRRLSLLFWGDQTLDPRLAGARQALGFWARGRIRGCSPLLWARLLRLAGGFRYRLRRLRPSFRTLRLAAPRFSLLRSGFPDLPALAAADSISSSRYCAERS